MSRWRGPLAVVAVTAVVAGLSFHFVQRQLSGAWLGVGASPEVLEALESSREDQRQLATHEPQAATHYRERFDALQTLIERMRIVQHNRADLLRRYEQILLAATVLVVLVVAGFAVWRQTRRETRLARLGQALAGLAAGRSDLDLGAKRNDLIGRIASMIERTSRVMAHDRRRLKALQNLSAWQEAARRHAHEMRTPLTGARLELARIEGLAERDEPPGEELQRATRSVLQELERLSRFTQAFTSFARLPRPHRQRVGLRQLVDEFVTTFAEAWPSLDLVLDPASAEAPVAVDRDMVRQVLVNLCDNGAHAITTAGLDRGTVHFVVAFEDARVTVDVSDDGPGVDPSVQDRLFEPYTTTRGIGEGMGLGLAICKKIMLDHGGDLELAASSSAGTTFRLTLPHADAVEETDSARAGHSVATRGSHDR